MWSKNFSETVSRFRRRSSVVTALFENIALIQLSYVVAFDDHYFDCDDDDDVHQHDDSYDDNDIDDTVRCHLSPLMDMLKLSQYPVYSLLPYAN